MPFRLIMDSLPSLIFVKDEASRIVYANKAFLEVYHPKRRDQIVGRTTVEDFTPEEAAVFLAEDRRAFDLGRTEIVEEITDYTGRRKVFKTRKIAFIAAAGERRLLGVCDDITELANREKALAESNRLLQSFAAVAAHDLRSPLASMVNALQLIEIDKETALSPRAKGYLGLTIEGATGLAQTIESLLIAAKASDQGVGIETAPCDVNLVLENVRFALSALIERTSAHVISSRLPTIDVGDKLFQQLLQNLVENSIKYRCSDAPPIIVIRHEADGNGDVFSIEDNGIGMAGAVAARAFMLYEQNGQGAGGVGLGLSLCKKIVELHGGRIWIDREYKSGCKIVWTIPAKSICSYDEPTVLKTG